MAFCIDEVTTDMENDVNNFGLIPEGEHNFLIENAREAPNKKQDGEYLELTCLLEGTNKKQWIYFNLKHPNNTVVNMAKVQLKKLLTALKMTGYESPEELKDKVFRAQIEHVKNKDGKYQEKFVAFDEYKWSGNMQKEASVSDENVPF